MIVESDYKSESGGRAHLDLWPEMLSELGLYHSRVLIVFGVLHPLADQMRTKTLGRDSRGLGRAISAPWLPISIEVPPA